MTVAARERSIDYELLPHQYKALYSERRLVGAFMGVGAGKTSLAGSFVVRKGWEAPEGVAGLIAANTYPQLRDSTLRRCYATWNELGVVVDPPILPQTYGPSTIRLWNGRHKVEIFCRSVDNPAHLAGLELGFFVQDEAWDSVREAFEELVKRMRDEREGFNRQGLVISWKDDPDHWMHEEFVDNFDPAVHEVIEAKTSDNWHLPDDYIPNLQRSLSRRMFERMVLNKWVSLRGATIYHAFQRNDGIDEAGRFREGNVTELADFDPALPVCWSHDFNIGQGKPMSSCLAQIKRGPHGPVLDVFAEIVLESTDTNDAIAEHANVCAREGWHQGARIYGDASGRAKDTRSKTTDYELLRAAGFVDQRVPKANPPIRDRHNAVNGLLCNAQGHVRLRIHPRCKTLIKGLETVKLRAGAQYLEEETYEQHVTTALGYLVAQEFPVVERRVESGTLAIFRRR